MELGHRTWSHVVGSATIAKGNMQWEEYMRSGRCQHEVGVYGNLEVAMSARVSIINEFQNIMPAKKKTIGNTAMKEWCEIRDKFTNELQNAEKELLKLKEDLE